MTDEARSTIVVVIGAVLLRLGITGVSARYVRTSMTPWLLLSGLALVALGLLRWAGHRSVGPAQDHAHAHAYGAHLGHDHESHSGERIGWLLLAPIGCLLLVAPPSLGSYALGHTGRVTIERQAHSTFQPLRAGGALTVMTILEFNERALIDGPKSFGDSSVTLTGFVAQNDTTRVRLARYQIACCAADAVAAIADLEGVSASAVSRDSWLTVTGTFAGVSDGNPRLRVDSVQTISAPADPYE